MNFQYFHPKYWLTWIGVGILRFIAFLPLPVVARLGNAVGLLFYKLVKSRREIALRNIQSCFPELSLVEQQRINKQHFLISGQLVFATSLHWWCSKKRFNNFVTLKGREHYDKALQDGKNIILLAPHFMSLEVGGLVLAQERPMATMYQYNKNKLMDQIIRKGRTRFGGVLVERKQSLKHLMRLIRDGQPFYYLPDQDGGRKGIFVPFFNELASTIPMLGKFASFGGAVVIPCRNKVLANGKGYEVILSEPLENFPSGNDVVDTTRMNQEVEKMIREAPEQYLWSHKRFKTRPEGEPAFYK